MRKHRISLHRAGIRSASPSILLALALVGLLTACGTTSKLEKPQPTAESLALADDLSGYSHVVVLDFADKVTAGVDVDEQEQKRAEMEIAGRHFADLIANEIRAGNQRVSVARTRHGKPDTVVVSGEITRLEQGNETLRFMIGFGAGGSYFDATVRITDAQTGNLFGTVVVDKNSWALGGAVAASQSVDDFMQGAAKKIAVELQTASLGATAPE